METGNAAGLYGLPLPATHPLQAEELWYHRNGVSITTKEEPATNARAFRSLAARSLDFFETGTKEWQNTYKKQGANILHGRVEAIVQP